MARWLDAPTELLVEIFDIIHQPELYSDTRSSILIPFTLSHVCRHWRSVILDLPHHWTHIHLSHTRQSLISQQIFRRSKSLPLSLSLGLTNSPSPIPRLKEFLAVLTDSSVAGRLRDLRIIGRNTTISRIAAGFTDFPALENLIIRQVQPVEDHNYVGPFTFNPGVFKSLTLEGVGFHSSHSSALSGLTSLTLVRAAESILNQITLLDYNPPATPYAPCMTQLETLRLIGTPPIISNQRTRPELFSPSFDRKTLKCLHLSDYESDIPIRIVRSSLNPMVLEEIELEDIRGHALTSLIGLISDISAATPSPFARVHTLTIRKISGFSSQSQSQSLATYLLRAFPQLRVLRLLEVDKVEFVAALRDPGICPEVSVLVDGVELSRPPPIMMIAPPT